MCLRHGGTGRLSVRRAHLQMWNTWRTTPEFRRGTPWLLRFFDQIRFYPVDAEELLEIRDAFPHGRFHPEITETQFRLRDYHAFLEEHCLGDGAFRRKTAQRHSMPNASAGKKPVRTVNLKLPNHRSRLPRERVPRDAAPSNLRRMEAFGTWA